MSARSIWEELLDGGWSVLSRWRSESRAEGLHLDFKQGAMDGDKPRVEDRKNLAKGISGFANTEGGLLIFGARTSRGPDKADNLSGLEGVGTLDVYAEQLRARAKDSTTPTVPGIDVRAFPDPGRTNDGVVVVYVPTTDGLPYRAEGPDEKVAGKYFIRTTSDTTVMSHQLLAAMFGRRPHPDLKLGFALADMTSVHVYVQNVGRGTAAYPFARIRFERPDHLGAIIFNPRDYWEDRSIATGARRIRVGK